MTKLTHGVRVSCRALKVLDWLNVGGSGVEGGLKIAVRFSFLNICLHFSLIRQLAFIARYGIDSAVD